MNICQPSLIQYQQYSLRRLILRPKRIILFFICCSLILLFFLLPPTNNSISVFRVTEKPATIIRGTSGSTLTINLSFGDDPIKEWISTLEKPYPLFFINLEWAERFPETIQLMKNKKVPTGLLGGNGRVYETDEQLLTQQAQKYEQLFGQKPLWFRTSDEVFPAALQTILWREKINALGSSIKWTGEKMPPMIEGEIISVSFHKDTKINIDDLEQLTNERNFKTLEEVLFGPVGKVKKIPK